MEFDELYLFTREAGNYEIQVNSATEEKPVMKLHGLSRTYSHTAEPRFVQKANKTSELPEITSADAGKVLGVTEEGKIAPVEGGGEIPILHITGVDGNYSLVESFDQVNEILENYADNFKPIYVVYTDDNQWGFLNTYMWRDSGLVARMFDQNSTTGALIVSEYIITLDGVEQEVNVTLNQYEYNPATP